MKRPFIVMLGLLLNHYLSAQSFQAIKSYYFDNQISGDYHLGLFFTFIIIGIILAVSSILLTRKWSRIKRIQLLLGILFFTIFLVSGNQVLHFISSYESTHGTIVGHVEDKRKSLNSETYRIVHLLEVRFTSSYGNQYVFTTTQNINPEAYPIGETIGVMYDPKNPTAATIHTFTGWVSIYWLPLLLLFLSIYNIPFRTIIRLVMASDSSENTKKALKLIRKQLGNQTYEDLVNERFNGHLDLSGKPISDLKAALLPYLHPVYQLDLSRTKITDLALQYISKMEELQTLTLSQTAVSDRGIHHLASLTELTHLDLRHTRITSDSLQYLTNLPLQSLALSRTQVDNQCVPFLVKLDELLVVDLNNTKVTREGIDQLRLAKPAITLFTSQKKSSISQEAPTHKTKN